MATTVGSKARARADANLAAGIRRALRHSTSGVFIAVLATSTAWPQDTGPLEAVAAVEKAAGNGVRIGCFRPPSTPDGISRLRLTAHAQLDDDELSRAVGVLDGLL